MRKSFYFIVCAFVSALLGLSACSETQEVDEYANWQLRNEHFIDSIAKEAKTNASGEWKILKSCSLQPDSPTSLKTDQNPLDYIYIRVLENGTGKSAAAYNDTVRVHYRGKLINNVQFDSSFKGTLNSQTAVPAKFEVQSVINGWTTALLQMKEGDHWEVYIPWSLAYGPGVMAGSNSSMKEYSVLYFEMQLAKIYSKADYVGKPIPDWN